MRDVLKSSVRWLGAGWFWLLVLLALPTCGLQNEVLEGNPDGTGEGGPVQTFEPGSSPTSAIMCDIPTADSPHCASDAEVATGFDMAEAAILLAEAESTTIGLDYSPAAVSACGGKPRATVFYGPYPDGYAVCLNCGTQIPEPYGDFDKVCIAQCRDLINSDGGLPAGGVDAFCAANAHVSTNFDKSSCYENACSTGGTLLPTFVDPRRTPEPVKWTDQTGTSSVDGSLTRADPTSPVPAFDAGAASDQAITYANARVEFEVPENNLSHVLGLSSVPCYPCSDSDPGLTDIDLAISLNYDGNIYLLEHGNLVYLSGADINGAYGTYSAGDRFAFWVRDNYDGSANVSIWRVSGTCMPNISCVESRVVSNDWVLSYPLRVDASLREQNAALANVIVVHIQ